MSYSGSFKIMAIQPYSKSLYDSGIANGNPVPPPVNIDVLSNENNDIFVTEENYAIVIV